MSRQLFASSTSQSAFISAIVLCNWRCTCVDKVILMTQQHEIAIEPATPSKSRAGQFTIDHILSLLDSDNENELLNGVDYPSDETAESSPVRVSGVGGPSIAT